MWEKGKVSLQAAGRVGFEPAVGTSPTTVFETVPFNHSGTSPMGVLHYTKRGPPPASNQDTLADESSNRQHPARWAGTPLGRRSGRAWEGGCSPSPFAAEAEPSVRGSNPRRGLS